MKFRSTYIKRAVKSGLTCEEIRQETVTDGLVEALMAAAAVGPELRVVIATDGKIKNVCAEQAYGDGGLTLLPQATEYLFSAAIPTKMLKITIINKFDDAFAQHLGLTHETVAADLFIEGLVDAIRRVQAVSSTCRAVITSDDESGTVFAMKDYDSFNGVRLTPAGIGALISRP